LQFLRIHLIIYLSTNARIWDSIAVEIWKTLCSARRYTGQCGQSAR